MQHWRGICCSPAVELSLPEKDPIELTALSKQGEKLPRWLWVALPSLLGLRLDGNSSRGSPHLDWAKRIGVDFGRGRHLSHVVARCLR